MPQPARWPPPAGLARDGPTVGLVRITFERGRKGWFITQDRLVVGEPATAGRVSSPVLMELFRSMR